MRTRLIDSLPLTETFIRCYYSVDSFAAVWGTLCCCAVVWEAAQRSWFGLESRAGRRMAKQKQPQLAVFLSRRGECIAICKEKDVPVRAR